jgi:hypothetical protein
MAPTPKKVPTPPKPQPTPTAPSKGTTRPSGTIAPAPQRPQTPPSAIKPQAGILAPGKPTATTTTSGSGTNKPKNQGSNIRTGLGSPVLTDIGTSSEAPARDWQQEYYDQLKKEERRGAYDILKETFQSYGLDELVPDLERFFKQGLGPREATIALRETESYKERFRGNEGRRAMGLAAYNEAEYLSAENTYSELLRSSGLDSIANRKTFASLIGGAVSLAETQDRIQNVFNRIDNADENLKKQLGQYFNQYGVGDPAKQRADIAAAILGGPETAQSLQRQLQRAELRTGAAMAGLGVSEEKVGQLQKQFESLGVSNVYGTAMAGFKELSEVKPLTEVLAERYKTQTEGLEEELEQEAFFGLQSQRRKKLQEKERATFSGQAGTTQVSLSQAGLGGSI